MPGDNDGRILVSLDHTIEYFGRLYRATLIAIQMHPHRGSLIKELDFTKEPKEEGGNVRPEDGGGSVRAGVVLPRRGRGHPGRAYAVYQEDRKAVKK